MDLIFIAGLRALPKRLPNRAQAHACIVKMVIIILVTIVIIFLSFLSSNVNLGYNRTTRGVMAS